MTVVLMTIINIVNKRGKKQKVICENVDCILVKSVREKCTTNRDEHSILLHSILLRYNSRSLPTTTSALPLLSMQSASRPALSPPPSKRSATRTALLQQSSTRLAPEMACYGLLCRRHLGRPLFSLRLFFLGTWPVPGLFLVCPRTPAPRILGFELCSWTPATFVLNSLLKKKINAVYYLITCLRK